MKTIMLGLFLCAVTMAFAQDPVHWNYSLKKIDAKNYEVHATATMDAGWHIYAQTQPSSAIAVPTKIIFTKNPFLVFNGKVKGIGKIEKQVIKEAGIEQNMYENNADFVQLITLKGSVKTSVNGNITYQACTNEMCLPEKTISFIIPIE